MWGLLRDRRLADCKFRRQHPVPPYILDFYCHAKHLAIEVDGGQHNTDDARRADKSRSNFLATQGIRVLRFWNHDVLQDTETVLEAIWNALHVDQGTLTPNPSPKGRGEPMPLIRVAVTKLRMDPLTDAQLEEYLSGGGWEGKAGAFGYQDRLGWVHIVEGSASNVVGLPMELLAEMLADLGARN
jgi:very-short-patch-repair endonuclease